MDAIPRRHAHLIACKTPKIHSEMALERLIPAWNAFHHAASDV
jgi:hypothetical protein